MSKPTKLTLATHEVVTYSHMADYGETLQTVTAPEYWTHVARRLAAGVEIIVTAADLSWRARLVVLAAGRAEARVGVLYYGDFTEEDKDILEDELYEVKFRGPRKFSVIRKADNEILKENLTKREAVEWVRNREKAA